MQEEQGLTCIKTYFIMRDGKRRETLAGTGRADSCLPWIPGNLREEIHAAE